MLGVVEHRLWLFGVLFFQCDVLKCCFDSAHKPGNFSIVTFKTFCFEYLALIEHCSLRSKILWNHHIVTEKNPLKLKGIHCIIILIENLWKQSKLSQASGHGQTTWPQNIITATKSHEYSTVTKQYKENYRIDSKVSLHTTSQNVN